MWKTTSSLLSLATIGSCTLEKTFTYLQMIKGSFRNTFGQRLFNNKAGVWHSGRVTVFTSG